MKKLIALATVTIFFLSACQNEIDFVDEGVFVQLEPYSASEGTYLEHFPKIITIANDGSVRVTTKEAVSRSGRVEMEVGEDAPMIEKEISQKEVEQIKRTIEKNDFLSLPKDVTDYDVMDGDGSRIYVYTKDEIRKVGGENSQNEKFLTIRRAVFRTVEEEYEDWVEETEEYLRELNGD